MLKRATVIALLATSLTLPLAADAHHSFSAEFDVAKVVHLEGTVVQFSWVNPHSWIYMDVVKPDGRFAVYLYSRYGIAHRVSDVIRPVTTRLPLGLMWGLSAVAVPLYYLYRIPVIGKIANLAVPISLERHWQWRWLDTFDWYTPKYQFKYLYPEIFRWYQDAGFHELEIFGDPVRMSGQKRSRTEETDGRQRWRDLVAS